jgi:hypothetical protein
MSNHSISPIRELKTPFRSNGKAHGTCKSRFFFFNIDFGLFFFPPLPPSMHVVMLLWDEWISGLIVEPGGKMVCTETKALYIELAFFMCYCQVMRKAREGEREREPNEEY